jgi:glycosyltransferase involved in cell wall biosynthesis
MSVLNEAVITVVIPSLNQGRFLEEAIRSALSQSTNIEVIVMDGGSNDETQFILERWSHKLKYWKSEADGGQAAAINAGMKLGTAPYVCWLNSDDYFFPNALQTLADALRYEPTAPMVYGRCLNVTVSGRKVHSYPSRAFSERLFANYCFIPQPATLIRRDTWEALGGLSEELHLAFDYDFWWRSYKHFGVPIFVDHEISVNRMHANTKTHNLLDYHYDESMRVVLKYYGRIPIKWYVMRPVMRLVRSMAALSYRSNSS